MYKNMILINTIPHVNDDVQKAGTDKEISLF